MQGRAMLRTAGAGLVIAALLAAGGAAQAKGPGSGGGSGKPPSGESIGNNLSYPLLIAGEAGYAGPVLRGTEYAPLLGTLPSDYLVLPDGTRAYYQQNANNTWQASNANLACAGRSMSISSTGATTWSPRTGPTGRSSVSRPSCTTLSAPPCRTAGRRSATRWPRPTT